MLEFNCSLLQVTKTMKTYIFDILGLLILCYTMHLFMVHMG